MKKSRKFGEKSSFFMINSGQNQNEIRKNLVQNQDKIRIETHGQVFGSLFHKPYFWQFETIKYYKCRHAAMTTLFKLTSYVSRKSFLPDRIGLKFLWSHICV